MNNNSNKDSLFAYYIRHSRAGKIRHKINSYLTLFICVCMKLKHVAIKPLYAC